jgi:hypothetical protein
MTDYALEIVAESQDLALTVTESVTSIAVTVSEAAAPIALTVGVQGPPGPPGEDGGADLTADALMLLTYNSLGFLLIGGTSAAGSDPPTPSEAVQALIDQALGLGIPEEAIGIIYTGEAAVVYEFIVADVASLSEAAAVVLTQSGGTFAIAAVASLSGVENVVITSEDVFVFTIADAGSLSGIENITITSIGQFVIAEAASASEIANVVMTQSGGTFAVAAVASASGIDNVEITEQAGADYFGSGTEGWTLENSARTTAAAHTGSWSIYGSFEGFYDGELEEDASGWVGMTRSHNFVTGQVFSVWYKASAGTHISFADSSGVGEDVPVVADNTWRQATSTWVAENLTDTLHVSIVGVPGAGNFATGYLDDFTITGP